MYKLILGIGWNALKTRFDSYDSNERVSDWKRIDQHKILLNKSIIDCYMKQAQAEGVVTVDRVKQYISSIANNHSRSEKAYVKGTTIQEIFGNFFDKYKYDEIAIIYGENDKICSKNKCENQYKFEDDVFKDEKNTISLHSYNNITKLYPNENAKKYLNFIGHILKETSVVNFIDPYILSNNSSRYEYINTYLPMIAEKCVVNLFVSDEDVSAEQIEEIVKATEKRNIEIHIWGCKKEKMHDRFITTDDMVLTIGAGILFYKQSDLSVREVCSFAYEKKKTGEYLELENKLAGGEIKKLYSPEKTNLFNY